MAKRLRARPSNTLILVVGSFVILVLVGIAGLNRPLPSYLVASSNLASGTQLQLGLVTAEPMDLGSIADNYATPSEIDGSYLVLPIPAGELIPKRALGQPLGFNQTSIRIIPNLKPASQITHGSRVSIWQVVESDGTFQSQLIVPSAIVTDLIFGEGLFAAEVPEVELVLSREQATLVLQAVTSEAAIYLLPVS
jgi:hypothetical protein